MGSPNIFVTGGAGFIGSLIVKLLHKRGFHPVILDDLSTGSKKHVLYGSFHECDIGDQDAVSDLLLQYKPACVIHLAAKLSVAESVKNPLETYETNVFKTIAFLKTLLAANVTKLIFSSTAAVYGAASSKALTENSLCNPINPYGDSKLSVERLLDALSKQGVLQSIVLRYFNVYGADPEGEIPINQSQPHNLIPILLKSVLEGDPRAYIFGTDYNTKDGTCIRDYIHVYDIANAHLIALSNLLSSSAEGTFNLSSEKGVSVLEVIKAVENVSGVKLKLHFENRREGDPPVLFASSEKFQKTFGWSVQYKNLEEGIKHALRSMKKEYIEDKK